MGGHGKRLTERLNASVQNPYVRRVSGQAGVADVSGRKRAWLELVGQTVRLAAAGETVAERAPFPPPPHAVVAGATPKFF